MRKGITGVQLATIKEGSILFLHPPTEGYLLPHLCAHWLGESYFGKVSPRCTDPTPGGQ